MQTPIGNRLSTPRRRAAALFLAAFVVISDFVLVWLGDHSYSGPRLIPPIVALTIYGVLVRGDLTSLGFGVRPVQGYRYWATATLLIGLVVGLISLTVGAVYVAAGVAIPILGVPLPLVPQFLFRMCVVAPLVEELIYRSVLCTLTSPSLKPGLTIAVSGVAFAFLHVLYGNPGPDNFAAGFLLAWAYLKSGTILTPVFLHSLGNLCVLAVWVFVWYWRSGIH
ncbi:lysostaphin resistance A-like protein [Singulisphaera rosea]